MAGVQVMQPAKCVPPSDEKLTEEEEQRRGEDRRREREVRGWIKDALEMGLEGSAILGSLHDKSRSLEMSDMQAALRSESAAINGEMLDLMSSKYGEFFEVAESVSSGCECRETRDALIKLHGQLGVTAREAGSGRRELEAELERRRAAAKQHREAQAIERFEILLGELEAAISSEGADVERCAHAALSLRAQLSSAVELISDGSRVTQLHEMSHRVDEAERGAAHAVEKAFERLCCSRREGCAPEAVQVCLRAAAALGLGPRLEDVYGEMILKAFLTATFTRSRLDGSDRGSCAGLPSIYAATLEFVQERCQIALQACEAAMSTSAPSSLPSLLAVDLVCNGVWRPIAAAVLDRLSPIFELGIAATIHKSYQATFRFLEDLARLATASPSTEASPSASDSSSYVSRRLRAHPATRELERRWDLGVYFELVKVDLVSKLDAALFQHADDFVLVQRSEDGVAAAKKPSPSAFVDELLRAVDRLWETEPTKYGYFLKPIAHKCTELTFDLVSKALRASTERLENDDKPSPHALAQLAFDIHFVEQSLSTSTPAKVANALRGLDQALPEDVPVDALVLAMDQSALRPVRSIKTRALDKLAAALAKDTARGLEAVKGVAARYNLTNQPAPTDQPSDYLDQDALNWLCDDFGAVWTNDRLPAPPDFKRRIALDIIEHYVPMVHDVLEQALNLHLSLRKRGKRPSHPDGLQLSDLQKIASQLLLDVNHLQTRLTNFGVTDNYHSNAPLLDTPSLDRLKIVLGNTIANNE